ncbi:hypothetical protein RHGRI_015777 [Rhododendron griersonianum]|uniref:Late embryogenesis abundant protein LEA-2 subgroup domain-containing protein n=1 Tax=Rhododendron griersonianum TaxID=479676 RepID=A0AAV6JNH2_9ERIC|nr:hypothetical protein RHGRI_015777 [Rhododendron griersonianum]
MFFYYGETEVGSVVIPKSKAQFRRTKQFTVSLDLTSTNLAGKTQLANDLSLGIVPLSSRSKLTRKVELILISKKKKAVDMNCIMEVNTGTQSLLNFSFK